MSKQIQPTLTESSAEASPSSQDDPNSKTSFKPRKYDWGFIYIPKYLRHDPENPFKFTMALNLIFAITSTASITQLYISTPILTRLSEYFEVPYDTVVDVVTLTQVGYLIGLLLLCPLGDLARRRQLILTLLFCASCFTVILCFTDSWIAFQIFSFFVGMASVIPQIMLPFAGDLAPNHRRASALSICVSGLLLGQVVARVISGVFAEVGNWRIVYYFGLGIQCLSFITLYLKLPDFPERNPDLTYPQILSSMLKLLLTKPVVIQSGLIGGISSAGQLGFWVSLTFVLTNVYGFNTLQIGLFGLIGLTGVLLSPFIGRFIDRIVPWYGALFGICIMYIAWSLYTALADVHYGVLIAIGIMLDPAQQLQNVSNLTRISAVDPAARTRLNSIQIVFIFVGQLIASSIHSRLFLSYGTKAVGGFCLGTTTLATIALLCRGPHETRWFGWKGGWSIKKGVPQKPKVTTNDQENNTANHDTDDSETVPKQASESEMDKTNDTSTSQTDNDGHIDGNQNEPTEIIQNQR